MAHITRGTQHAYAHRTDEKTKVGALAGEFIYAVRTPDGSIKIGHTTNADRRLRFYGSASRPLALVRGTRRMESVIHASLRPYVARGREYYHVTPEVLAVVNHLRAKMGKRPLKLSASVAD